MVVQVKDAEGSESPIVMIGIEVEINFGVRQKGSTLLPVKTELTFYTCRKAGLQVLNYENAALDF